MKPLLNLALLLAVTTCASYALADDYRRPFGDGWHVTRVSISEVTLLSESNYPCQVKAVGWKLLAAEHRKGKDAHWYSIGDRWEKWGFKIVLTNPGDQPVQAWCRVRLRSTDGFVLDSMTLGDVPIPARGSSLGDAPSTSVYNPRWFAEANARADALQAAIAKVYPAKGAEPTELQIAPGDTASFQNASWYNTATQQGEGDPASVEYAVGCEEAP